MKKLFLCLSILSILSMPLAAKVMVVKPDAPAAGGTFLERRHQR